MVTGAPADEPGMSDVGMMTDLPAPPAAGERLYGRRMEARTSVVASEAPTQPTAATAALVKEERE